eukprot:9467091-Pyramimonas_sp.AAC.1
MSRQRSNTVADSTGGGGMEAPEILRLQEAGGHAKDDIVSVSPSGLLEWLQGLTLVLRTLLGQKGLDLRASVALQG